MLKLTVHFLPCNFDSIIDREEFWVNAKKHPTKNGNSLSRVVNHEYLNTYLRKYHPDKAKNLPGTGLAVIKVKIILMLKQKIISAFKMYLSQYVKLYQLRYVSHENEYIYMISVN